MTLKLYLKGLKATNKPLKHNGILYRFKRNGDIVMLRCDAGRKQLTIPEGVAEIGDGAFRSCDSLRKIVIPWDTKLTKNSLTGLGPDVKFTVGSYTFKIGTIQSKLEQCGGSAVFRDLCRLRSGLAVTDDIGGTKLFKALHTSYALGLPLNYNGCSYAFNHDDSGTVNGISLIQMIPTMEQLDIPEGVTYINVKAVKQDSGVPRLRSLAFPSTLTQIPAYTFSGLNSLRSIKFPALCPVTIGTGAFKDCKHLTSAILPSKLRVFPNDLFNGCEALTTITIPSRLQSIGSGAFKDCRALTSITLPETVKQVGEYAFSNSGLKSLTVLDAPINIGDYCFKGCSSLRSVSLGKKANTLGIECFADCHSLERIKLSETITDISRAAFKGCSKLREIKLPKLYNLGDMLFMGCKSLESVNLKDGLMRLGFYVFSSCTSLKQVRLPRSVKSVPKNAFSNTPGDMRIIGPASALSSLNDTRISYYNH